MNNMLGISLCEVRGLFKDLMDKLCGEDWEKWLEAFKHFLRGEPTWAEEMIYTPLEWSLDFGEVPQSLLQEHIDLHNKGHVGGWRLPTLGELTRKMKKDGRLFVTNRYYWTSTDCKNDGVCIGKGLLKTYDNRGGLCHSCSRDVLLLTEVPRLCFCRQIKLPE